MVNTLCKEQLHFSTRQNLSEDLSTYCSHIRKEWNIGFLEALVRGQAKPQPDDCVIALLLIRHRRNVTCHILLTSEFYAAGVVMRRMRWRVGQCSCASGASIQLLPSAALLKKRAPSSSHPAPSPRWTPLLQRCTPPASASVNDTLIMHQERMKALAGSRNTVSAVVLCCCASFPACACPGVC